MIFAIFAEQLPFTAFLNRVFGGMANAILGGLGIHPHDAMAPISNFVAMQIVVFLLLLAFFLVVRSRLSVDEPGAVQHSMEFITGFYDGLGKEIIGHGYERFVPYLVAVGMYILTSNLLGLIPGFESPTANPSVPLGMAVCTFVYYNAHGFRQQGAHYVAHFMGPVTFLAPLVFPIEIISHCARVMSLTVRLFANIFAGDMLTLAFFSLIPIGVPVVFLGLHIGVSLIQTYIFTLLTAVYLLGAVGEEH